VAGLAAAVELARHGLASLVAERSPRLGGRVAGFGCKAVEACAQCGACRLDDLLAEAASRPQTSCLTCALAAGARPRADGWRVELLPQPAAGESDPVGRPLAEKATVDAGAVILAVGYEPFDPRLATRFGYGRVPGVVTASELEAMLGQGVLAGPEGGPPARVAFIQCVGSRDRRLGNLYCSRVCCGFALDMARLVTAGWPETEVTFYHMDVQGYGPGWEEEVSRLRGEVEFVRAMPGEVACGPEGKAQVRFAGSGRPAAAEHDLVVLSTGLTPPASAGALAEMFGLERTADGFLGAEADAHAAGPPGVWVAGCARGPRGILESMEHAAGAAARAAELFLRPEGRAAHGQG
jgi:heterodisulfide reductase subunit A